ncbi:uncharacterized protein [Choristoneura fumiferana]|uniref:uncharacterized protein n=1 Tax=Choristoneura fumiferana TaxID=7141 RepID=UPI003D15C28C
MRLKSVYVFCEKAERNEKGGWDYEIKPYKPASFLLQDIAIRLAQSQAPWDSYVDEGLQRLRGVPGRWDAPAGSTDRLCVDVGNGAFIEVSHPAPQGDQVDRGGLRVHCAPVAGGARCRRRGRRGPLSPRAREPAPTTASSTLCSTASSAIGRTASFPSEVYRTTAMERAARIGSHTPPSPPLLL